MIPYGTKANGITDDDLVVDRAIAAGFLDETPVDPAAGPSPPSTDLCSMTMPILSRSDSRSSLRYPTMPAA
ncbi:hypothetical protein KBX37_11395 [Micromonospora sp. U56]|uniref:hypothetical protein n=1 Tax=Micromonospora sp. U56 TaxID=2824900 RepID=UPI001B370FF7|nr:hypothetical protein [Micromonospora sp. U56]MBQ0893693.1 hypothetical protein [Micromonospora sp. U56]